MFCNIIKKMDCEHSTRRTRCRICKGGSICEHDKRRTDCKICNPLGHLKNVISAKVYYFLKKDKKQKTVQYLGGSIEELKNHIEKSFKDGMTWENMGKVWSIDHIVPIKYNNPTLEQVHYRLHYLNTQALTISENSKKGNRYI